MATWTIWMFCFPLSLRLMHIWDLFFYGLGSALMQSSFFSNNSGLEPSSVHGSIEEAQEFAFKQHWGCSKTILVVKSVTVV